MDIQALLKRIDEYKLRIDRHRPLAPEEAAQLDAYFRIGMTYTSNALEGSTLTLTETKVLLEDGLTVGGKPICDCYEAIGHSRAYDYMLKAARTEPPVFTEEIILRLHKLFYSGIDAEQAGKYRDTQVFITAFLPPTADDVPRLMRDLITELNESRDSLHPVELSALAHRRLVTVHPFTNGNGRTARLLMNLVLISRGYQIVSIPPILRVDYIDALKATQREETPSDENFVKLIAECELESQKDYCRMLNIRLPGKDESEIT